MQPLGTDDPRTIGEYRLLRRLGAGGMGRVYLGRSPGGRTVAVKVVHAHLAADERFRARFRLEIEAGRRVGVDWTAPVLDADPDAEMPWVATGFVAGPSLQQAVETHGALPEHSVRALGAGLAEALTAVHRLELVHRDVKPSNVLLTLDGPRLIDFGIARAMDTAASLTATGVSIGSPGFMSPEQVLGRRVDRATDVFSMGAVLAFAATGYEPFPGDSSAVLLYKVVHEEAELHGLSGELREWVEAALAKEAADRPTSEELSDRLSQGAGAAALIVPGWLPGPVVEGVSRRAVELLELEAEPLPAPDQSRPPAEQAPPTAPTVLGGFGPPLYRTPPPRGLWPPTVAPRPYRPLRPPLKPASRWHLWWYALIVVCALLFGYVLLSGLRGFKDLASPGPGTVGGSSSSHGVDGAGEDGLRRVPADFVGTWRGTVRSQANNVELTVTVSKGEKGKRLVKLVHSMNEMECKGVARVDQITESKLVLTEYADGDSPEILGLRLCSDNPAKVELSLTADTLTYTSHDPVSGRPTGELERDGR